MPQAHPSCIPDFHRPPVPFAACVVLPRSFRDNRGAKLTSRGLLKGREQANAMAVPVWVAWDPKGEEAEAERVL